MTAPWRDFEKFKAERLQKAAVNFARKAWSKFAAGVWGEGAGSWREGDDLDEFWSGVNDADLSSRFTFCSSEAKMDPAAFIVAPEKSGVWKAYMEFLAPDNRGAMSLRNSTAMFCRWGSGIGVMHNSIAMPQAPHAMRVVRRGRDPGTGVVALPLAEFLRDVEVDGCMTH